MKSGLVQPPTWEEWESFPWSRAKRWLAIEDINRKKQLAEMERRRSESQF